MTKKIRKYIVKGISIYLLLISICCSLLFLSFSLDGDIETNASIGICEISNGEIYPKVLEHYLPMPWTYFLSSWAHYLQQDRFTDREMLKAVITPGDNIFERAMVPEYGRYWHGYLVFLRPILMFFPYEEIKYIGLIIHIFFFSLWMAYCMVIFSILFNIFYCLYCRKFGDEDKGRDIPNIFLYNWDDCSFFRFTVSTIADIRNSIAYYLCKRKKN